MSDETNLDELISSLNEADELMRKIQSTQNKIDGLVNGVRNKIEKLVYNCASPEELVELCRSLGYEPNHWYWQEAYDNSYGGDTDFEKTEWSDVTSHTAFDLNRFVQKKARELKRGDKNE